MKYLSHDEIDNYFIYADTDSLYLKIKAFEKIDKSIYHKLNIGKWDIENEHIEKIYILNHKKYTYLTNGKIKVKSAGVKVENFNTEMDFEKFVNTQFSDGVTVTTTNSIYNCLGTISIYNAFVEMKKGGNYPTYYTRQNIKIVKDIFNEIETDFDNNIENELLYIESEIGTFSARDFFQDEDTKNKQTLQDLKFLDYMLDI